jgi:hypothetical protein
MRGRLVGIALVGNFGVKLMVSEEFNKSLALPFSIREYVT